MIRTTDDFLADLRSDLGDRADIDDEGSDRDTLWSDADLLRYLNSAAARLASDTLALRKRFVVNVVAKTPTYRFPYWQLIEVVSCTFASPALGGRPRNLRQFDIDAELEREDYGVIIFNTPDFTAEGSPSHFTRDWDNDFLRVYPIPAVAGELALVATVLPDPIMDGAPIPFQAQQDWDLLLMWAKKLAYEKQDADVTDLSRAKAFEAEYMRTMPNRRSEIDRIRRDGGILRPR